MAFGAAYDAWLTNDPRIPSAAEEAAYERIADEHPDWTDEQVWGEMEQQAEAEAEAYWEARAEQYAENNMFGDY